MTFEKKKFYTMGNNEQITALPNGAKTLRLLL